MNRDDIPDINEDRKMLLKGILDGDIKIVDNKEITIKGINQTTGHLNINHNQIFGLGRFYPDDTISPICVSRHIKHTLFHYLNWVDLDMVKGHPTILFNIAKMNNVSIPSFEKYLSNPTEIFKMLIEYYSPEDSVLEEDNVKDIFNIMIYGGGHQTWLDSMESNNVEVRTTIPHQFVNLFKTDCKKLMDLIYINNPNIVDKVKGDLVEEYKIKTRTMSYFCGIMENEILHIAYKFLVRENVIKERECALEYDGLCFKKPDDESLDLNEILFNLNTKIKMETKMDVKMKWKDYNLKYIHQQVIDDRNNMIIAEPVNVLQVEGEVIINKELKDAQNYYEFKHILEQDHFKIINKSLFLKVIKDDEGNCKEFKYMKESDINVSYKHITYITEVNGENIKKTYISEWLSDINQLTYDDLGCYPPPLKCPDNIYNTWTPFRVECLKIEEPLTDYIREQIKTIETYIKNLCNNEEPIYNHFIRWFAQMLKFPALKTIIPTIISQQGAGKGNLIELFRQMMGNSKILETRTPDRDVWGNFNGLMANVFLINCDELSSKQQEQVDGIIKGLITNGEVTINKKGIDSYMIKSFHRFINTTNKEFSIKSSDDDRRNFIIRASDTKCKKTAENVKYHNDFRTAIYKDAVVYWFYKQIIDIDNLDIFHTLEIPKTEYHKLTIASSRPVYEQFLEYFVFINKDKSEEDVESSEYYKRFEYW